MVSFRSAAWMYKVEQISRSPAIDFFHSSIIRYRRVDGQKAISNKTASIRSFLQGRYVVL